MSNNNRFAMLAEKDQEIPSLLAEIDERVEDAHTRLNRSEKEFETIIRGFNALLERHTTELGEEAIGFMKQEDERVSRDKINIKETDEDDLLRQEFQEVDQVEGELVATKEDLEAALSELQEVLGFVDKQRELLEHKTNQ